MAETVFDPQNYKVSVVSRFTSEPIIKRAQLWWNHNYAYRRPIVFTAPPDGLPAGHTVTVFVPRSIYQQGKVHVKLRDLEVVYLEDDVPEIWTPLVRSVETVSNNYRVRFLLQAPLSANETISDRYYIYYGWPNAAPYARGELANIDWPLTAASNSPLVSYTRPGEHWKSGLSTTKYAKVSFQFWGPQVRIKMDKGPNFGIVQVQVDDGAWSDVDLYATTATEGTVVFTKSGLSSGMHEIRVRLLGQKNPKSTSIAAQFRSFEYKKHSTALADKEQHDESLFWGGGMVGA